MGAAELRSSPNMRRSTVVISGILKKNLTSQQSGIAAVLQLYQQQRVFSQRQILK